MVAPVAGHARDLITDLFGMSGVAVVASGIVLLMWVPALTHVAMDPGVGKATYSLAGVCFTGWGIRASNVFQLLTQLRR